MNWNAIIDQLKDPYERKARVVPGTLVALPLLIPLLGLFGPKDVVLKSLLGLVLACGAIYALSSISRGLGKRLEEKLVKRWGGMPTTLILRHRDGFLDSLSKARFHSEIKSKLGIEMPSAAQEEANPEAADDIYIGATRQLRELTRGKANGLLLEENIAYGFHRNMMAVRYIGIITSLAGITFALVLSKVLLLKPISLDFANLAEPGMVGGITLAVSLLLLSGWAFYFNEAAVKRIAYVYAERLFESLKNLPNKRKRSAATNN